MYNDGQLKLLKFNSLACLCHFGKAVTLLKYFQVAMAASGGLKTYSDVNGLDKAALNRHCTTQGIPTRYPQNAKVNLLCWSLGISTAQSTASTGCDKENVSPRWNPDTFSQKQLDEYSSLTPHVMAKMKNWSKSIKDIPDINEISVKMFLTNTNVITKEMSRTYKLCKPYKMKDFVHSMMYHKLPDHPSFTALQSLCNPSQSTSSDSVKLLFVILESESGDPVGGFCTCTAGRSQSCAHIGAALFSLAGFVASGKARLPDDPSCTDIPCYWSGSKGKKYFHQNIALFYFFPLREWSFITGRGVGKLWWGGGVVIFFPPKEGGLEFFFLLWRQFCIQISKIFYGGDSPNPPFSITNLIVILVSSTTLENMGSH